MATQPEITERDLRLRAQDILDAVEAGRAFTLTRDSRADQEAHLTTDPESPV